MPATPVTVEAHETPKLRSSCDDCGTAKVRCDRERPQCSRCKTLDLTCIYGLSRKSGKPVRKRLASDIETTLGKRRCIAPVGIKNYDRITAVGLQVVGPSSASPEQDLSSQPPEDLPFTSSNTNFDINGQIQLESDLFPSLPFDTWPQLGNWPQLDSFGPGLGFPAAPISEAASTTSKNSSQGSHSCPRESYEIFRDLICPSPSLHAPESNSTTVSAQLDQVLQFNRTAIERLTEVLTCPCAKSGHRAMVHASIISRILIWYQQAAGWTGSSSWGPRPADSSKADQVSSSSSSDLQSPSGVAADTATLNQPSLVQATGFAVEYVPVSVGTFSIEDENFQAAFRNQLVLSELKRIADLIKLFIAQDSGESPGSGSRGLYSHLGTWLQSEHSRTVNILRTRLKTLNGHLAS